MKIAIMQPYFFPYLGQFALLNLVDRFVLMDQVQYIRHGWINRNRILARDGDFQYIVAPVKKHSHKSMIYDIQVVDDKKWKSNILNQLDIYRKAPFYKEVYSIAESLASYQDTSITRVNSFCYDVVCKYLGLENKIEIASELQLNYENLEGAQDLALSLTKQLGGTAYYNPPGGTGLYDKDAFQKSGIALHFVSPKLAPYDQKRDQFVAGLSILDVMMFNSPQHIVEMINDCEIL